jgi:hypothetical protein
MRHPVGISGLQAGEDVNKLRLQRRRIVRGCVREASQAREFPTTFGSAEWGYSAGMILASSPSNFPYKLSR